MDPTTINTSQDKEAQATRRAEAMARLAKRRERRQNKDTSTQSIGDDDHIPAPTFEDAAAAPLLKKRPQKKVQVLVPNKPRAQPRKTNAPKNPSHLSKVTAVNEVVDEEDEEDDLEAQLQAALNADSAAQPIAIKEAAKVVDNDDINITAAEVDRYKNAANDLNAMNDKFTRSMQHKRYDAWGDMIPSSLDAMGVTAPSLATAKAQAAAVAVQVAKPKVYGRTITKSQAKQMKGGHDMPELGSLDSESSFEDVTIVSDEKFTYAELPTPVQPSAPLKRKHYGGLALPQKIAKVNVNVTPKRTQEQGLADDLKEHHKQTTASAKQRPVKPATGVKGIKKSNDIPIDDDTWWEKPIAEGEDLFGDDVEDDSAAADADIVAAGYENLPADDQTTNAQEKQHADEFSVKSMLSNGSLAALASVVGEDVDSTTENDTTESSIDESAVMAGAPVSMAADEHGPGEESHIADADHEASVVHDTAIPNPQKSSIAPVQSSKRAREIDEDYEDDDEPQPSTKKTKVNQPATVESAPAIQTATKPIIAGPMANFSFGSKRPSCQPQLRKSVGPAFSANTPSPHQPDAPRGLTGIEAIEQRNREVRARKQEDDEERERAEHEQALDYEARRAAKKDRRLSGEDFDESDEEGESLADLLTRKEAQAAKTEEARKARKALDKKMKSRSRK
ncbi:hypothetical protein LTR86_006747 [Recurvomyces mirabilis]|nr:hypothetical protein LTR86_006747 [Recurvomyces mirabilis]